MGDLIEEEEEEEKQESLFLPLNQLRTHSCVNVVAFNVVWKLRI